MADEDQLCKPCLEHKIKLDSSVLKTKRNLAKLHQHDKKKKPSGIESPVQPIKTTSDPAYWNVLSQLDLLNAKNTCLQIVQNILHALQVNPYEINEIIGSISKKVKYTQKNLYISTDVERILANVLSDSKHLLESHKKLKDLVTVQSVLRSWIKRRKYSHMHNLFVKSSLSQRNKLYRDLMKKEQKYCDALGIFLQEYQLSIKDLAAKKKPLLTDQEYQILFMNIEVILSKHYQFYRTLESLQAKWPDVDGLGHYFIKFADEVISEYGVYVQRFHAANKSLDNFMKREKFKAFIEQKSEETGFDIVMLLTLPLNQISDYRITLERLIESTPNETVDYSNLLKAHLIMAEASEFLLGQLAKDEDQPTITDAIKMIKKVPANLLENQNSFIRKGLATVTTPKPKKMAAILFMFSNVLVICKQNPRPPYEARYFFELPTSVLDDGTQSRKSATGLVLSITTEDNKKFSFSWTSPSDFASWHEAFSKQFAFYQKCRIFGVELSKVEQDPDLPVPRLFGMITRHLLHYSGYKAEGLFRIAGSKSVVGQLKEVLDKGVPPDFSLNTYEAVDLAALLKLYFRELPEPLLPFNCYEPLMTLSSKYEDSQEEMAVALKEKLQQIPKLNFVVLQSLIKFLRRISEHSEVNMMKASNLAICFSPNLLRPRVETIEFTLNITKCNHIIETMIERFFFIFDADEEEYEKEKLEDLEKEKACQLEEQQKRERQKELENLHIPIEITTSPGGSPLYHSNLMGSPSASGPGSVGGFSSPQDLKSSASVFRANRGRSNSTVEKTYVPPSASVGSLSPSPKNKPKDRDRDNKAKPFFRKNNKASSPSVSPTPSPLSPSNQFLLAPLSLESPSSQPELSTTSHSYGISQSVQIPVSNSGQAVHSPGASLWLGHSALTPTPPPRNRPPVPSSPLTTASMPSPSASVLAQTKPGFDSENLLS
eukprot:TRINITY_DN6304_c0_g1_i1.p1 TRINITY_DN6304_c0_g1~~TRINITY_DN6304_c0_g1_i1.p1  ORF type:complete len:1009 (+),score=168.11 TRINITY_DN6304_c0_g1_i1:207-3029(+)